MEIQWKYNGNTMEIQWKYNGNTMEINEKKIESKEIFDQSKIVTIIHDGQEYQLRVTKANKLILTK
ncbi:hemin uptake protein HemP [Poseidonibacter ostreae]|nr:hemin uptake protein HemP [Poseidonibacter ostreae]